ncbi:unnamed protein product [Victoria cruziana]
MTGGGGGDFQGNRLTERRKGTKIFGEGARAVGSSCDTAEGAAVGIFPHSCAPSWFGPSGGKEFAETDGSWRLPKAEYEHEHEHFSAKEPRLING